MKSGPHAGKTLDYKAELERISSFPVTAYEARYVGDDEKLADELVITRVTPR
jgi:hypothetical protein